MEILHFLSSKFAVYKRERLQIKSGLWWRAYGIIMGSQTWISTTITGILITYNLNVCLITEPKFEIPSGDPYTGGWCRPQTDGPALRAMALSKWGMVLNNNGQSDTAKSDVWPLVSFDMEWVVENWASTGCDLWEEVRSDNFYFNRFDITVLIFSKSSYILRRPQNFAKSSPNFWLYVL